jgi:DNA-3-methyladenine glycosylase
VQIYGFRRNIKLLRLFRLVVFINSLQMKLSRNFYQRPDVVEVARDLLGKVLYTDIDGHLCGGMIVETEAYAGTTDRASHAWNGRYTARTQTMYAAGGISYVYFCYGMHHLFNVVTNQAQVPHAVLVRAIEPTVGLPAMLQRRGMPRPEPRLTNGPGSVCRALGISRQHNALPLVGKIIWIADEGVHIAPGQVLASPRVGVAYAGEHADWPYRFRVKDNKWTGK